MLSYRHGFHAGNFADVLKHSLITLVINALKQKDKPFVYIDTHAGAGKYSLQSEFAQKTEEYRQGIGRIWSSQQQPDEIKDYLALVKAENVKQQLLRYPGSPQLARRLVRKQDRLQLSELHNADYEQLRQMFVGDQQVTVVKEDGLLNLNKKLPPIQRRGLVLIDPSYEVKSDYQKVVEALCSAHRRFATGIYALWYPVLQRDTTEGLMQRLVATGIPKQLRVEHCIDSDSVMHGMTGSGMLFINPPWQLAQQAEVLLPWLNQSLTHGRGNWKVEWQVPESV